ncbi:hypothetical protein [Caldibacillus thermoamylovorans]|uniref:hypothetical protein n=1 Tax=Caldibacillus thermoamylovorans TaxID=35841 RepID=UPI0012E067AE|nr:hypothetical protein [Caldibacillus thermoamylovorans]
MTTRPIFVVVFGRKASFFGDEARSRRRFWTESFIFWRRGPFSSSFLDGKLHFLATRSILVTVLSRKTPTFGDETNSRRRFEVENALFWRRE